MITRRTLLLLLVAGVLMLVPVASGAQPPPKWKVGDHVEVYDLYTSTWEKATIFLVEDYRPTSALYYKARLDKLPTGTSLDELLLTDKDIRALGTGASAKKFKVGTTVDVYYNDGDGHGRGTILAALPNSRYKVHFPGCSPKFDTVADALDVKTPPTFSRQDARIHFLVGKWVMFTPSYPNTVIHDGEVFREYGTGAKAPPLQINADGTYVWYFDFGKAPSKGRWVVDPKMAKTDTGTESVDGILIKDTTGAQWKVYRWHRTDHKDAIEAQLMCSGMTEIGSRA